MLDIWRNFIVWKKCLLSSFHNLTEYSHQLSEQKSRKKRLQIQAILEVFKPLTKKKN